MPNIRPLRQRDSWLGTRLIWSPCHIDQIESKCVLFPFRQQRAPWIRQKKLLAVVCCHQLMLFKLDQIPQSPLTASDAILAVKPAEYALSAISEWAEWPAAEAIMEGLCEDFCEFEPKRTMADYILKLWNADPLPGWTPVHRGHLGLSWVRDMTNNQTGKTICAEVASNAFVLYNKPLCENEAMRDQDILKSWRLHDMEPARLCIYLDAVDIVQARLMMRYGRMWLYQFCLSQEALPF